MNSLLGKVGEIQYKNNLRVYSKELEKCNSVLYKYNYSYMNMTNGQCVPACQFHRVRIRN